MWYKPCSLSTGLFSHPGFASPSSIFFLLHNPHLKFLTCSTGQCNFLSCFLVGSLPPGSHYFHSGSLSKFFSAHLHPRRGILVSTVKLFYQPVTSCLSLLDFPDDASCVPQNSLPFSFPLNMWNPQVWSSALCPPLSLPEALVTSFTFRANSAGFL